MKKNLLLALIITMSFTLTGCGNNDIQENEVLIKQLDIEEGCYKSEKNSNNLFCITEDLSYYSVLYKDGKYYRDDYYYTSPPTEEQNYTYKFETDGGLFDMYCYEDGKEYLALMCIGEEKNTFNCSEIVPPELSPSGKAESNKVIYTKVDEKFNKEIIESLPLYERNKEFALNFDGENISCNLTRSYSLTNGFSGQVISNCLKLKYNEEYVITQLDKSESWQIYSKRVSDEAEKTYGKIESLNYLISNYSYNVTVDGKSFGYARSFPIDPYNSNEKMIVNITKK